MDSAADSVNVEHINDLFTAKLEEAGIEGLQIDPIDRIFGDTQHLLGAAIAEGEAVAVSPEQAEEGSEKSIDIEGQQPQQRPVPRGRRLGMHISLRYALLTLLLPLPLLTISHFLSSSGSRLIMISIAASIATYCGAMTVHTIVPLVVQLVEWTTSKEWPRTSIKHFLALRHFTSATVAIAVLTVMLNVYFPYSSDAETSARQWQEASFYASRGSRAVLVLSAFVLAERWLIQRIAVHFHYANYAERIVTNNFALAMLQRLKEWLRAGRRRQSSNEREQHERAASPFRYRHLHPTVDDDAVEGPSNEEDEEEDEDELLLSMDPESSQALAETAYEALCPSGQAFLTPSDFDVLSSEGDIRPAQIERFFYTIDTDENGDLTLPELVSGIRRVYTERDVLSRALASNTKVIHQLDTIFLLVTGFLVVLLWLPIFEATLVESLTTLSTLAIGLQFVAESSASAAMASIIFVLVTHPFDVGDRTVIDGNVFVIRELGLWSTTLLDANGAVTYAPNEILAVQYISNLRRSPPQYQLVTIRIHSATTRAQFSVFEHKMTAFLTENERDFQPSMRFATMQVENIDSIRIDLRVEFRSNFQHAKRKEERMVRYMMKVRELMAECSIRLAPYHWE